MSAKVLAPGLLTTVQDCGRFGHRHLGVSCAGALDLGSTALANRLVGNADGAAVLEITLQGPTLRFDAPVRIAVLGAMLDLAFDGASLAGGRPLTLPPGTVRIGRVRDGVRAWLAVTGGIAVPPVLGSRSTDLRGGFGGLQGRALREGDALPLGNADIADPEQPQVPHWWVDPRIYGPADAPLRFVPARHPAAAALCKAGWAVDPRSDRQGLRLQGRALAADARSIVSAPVAPGTVQLPPDGQPIVLLADAQTTGGYPVLGNVIGCDLPRLAQLPPHAPLRFVACTRAQAWQLAREARAQRARLALAIAQRLE